MSLFKEKGLPQKHSSNWVNDIFLKCQIYSLRLPAVVENLLECLMLYCSGNKQISFSIFTHCVYNLNLQHGSNLSLAQVYGFDEIFDEFLQIALLKSTIATIGKILLKMQKRKKKLSFYLYFLIANIRMAERSVQTGTD